MDERLRFVARLLEGESMTLACREFGISRKTGYKIFNRYRQSGFESLTDRSRRPVRYANQLAPQVEGMIVGVNREKPHLGARKIREDSRQEHHPRRATSQRPGEGNPPRPPSRDRNHAVQRNRAQ
jgi:hypothetical protein